MTNRIYETASWERPFVALQTAMNRFVTWTDRLPGIFQLVLYPLILVISLVSVPLVVLHWLISTVDNSIRPPELPVLTSEELCEWARRERARWVARHRSLRESNPTEVADAIALPVIDALEATIKALDAGDHDRDAISRLAARLIDLPITTALDAHTIGICMQRHAERHYPDE